MMALALLKLSPTAMAQERPRAHLDEVMVTARRIEENVARVPLAVDVTATSSMGPGAVQDMGSLSLAHPGLAFESLWGGSLAAPLLRGLSQPSAAGDNVGVFVDEVYQAGRSSIDIDLLDLERIEVIRGPQNTLHGRSSFAGAIHYVSARPTSTPTGQLQVDAGSDQHRGARAIWSQRLADSRWLMRVAAGLRSGHGTWRSVEGESLGDYQRGSAVLSLSREPAGPGADQLVFNARHNQGRFGHPASVALEAADFNCGARGSGPGYWSYYCGHVGAATRPSLTPGLPDSQARATQASLRYSHAAGGLRLHSLSSYYRAASRSYRDFDGSSAGFWSGVCTAASNCAAPASVMVTRFAWPNVVSAPARDVAEWSQELRLESDPERETKWMLGLAGARTSSRDRSRFGADRGSLLPSERLTFILAANPTRVGPLSQFNAALVADSRLEQVLQSLTLSQQRSLAAFGALQWPLFDGARVRVELRAERESLHVDPRHGAFQPDNTADPAPVHFTSVTPRFSIDLARGEHWYGYVSLARGARSGGINNTPGLDAAERKFEPEYNWTTEMAAHYRSDALLRQAKVTLYRTDWRNAQITGLATTPGVGTLITTNTAGILSQGIEASARLQRGSVAMEMAFSIADASFRDGSDDAGSRAFCGLTAPAFSSDFCASGPPRSGATGTLSLVPYLDGNQTARAPRTSWNLTLLMQPIRLAGSWQLAAQASTAFQDDVFERPINGMRYGERTLISARATLSHQRWRIQLWGDNLTDARYVRAASSRGGAFYPSLPRPSDLLYAEGRRYGVTVGLDLTPP
jgi:iron complex outermembrane receptor protein